MLRIRRTAWPRGRTEPHPDQRGLQSDGHTLLIATYDDAIYRWDTRVEHAIAFACQAAGRDLTEQEWQANFTGRPYRTTCP